MSISRKRVIFYSFFIFIIGVFSIFSLAYYQLRNLGEVKHLAIEKIEKFTGRKVSIGNVEMDIVRGLSILLKDVSVLSRWDKKPELTARSVWVVVKLLPLLENKIEVKQIIIQGSSLRIVRNASGQFSLGDVKKWISQPSDSQLFKILHVSLMNQVAVEDGSIHFLDYLDQPKGAPLPLEIDHIYFSIRKGLFKSPFHFSLKGEIPDSGSSTMFQTSGDFDNFPEDNNFAGISIDGDVHIDTLNVSKFQPYLKKVLKKNSGDTWVSIDSSFSGSLVDGFKAEGVLKYSSETGLGKAVLSNPSFPYRGGFEYKVSMAKETITVEEMKTEVGPLKYKASGSFKNIFSKDPSVFMDLRTDPFQINKSIDYLPLKIFPEKYHLAIQKIFKNGSIKLNSLKFDGTVKQLSEISKPENLKSISGELEMRKVDWMRPLPPMREVTGTFKFDKGNSSFLVQKASYYKQPFSNLRGSIKNFMTQPVADLSLENKVDIARFHRTMQNAFKGHPIHDAISIYSDLEGSANLRLNVQGPIEDFDKLAMEGVIDLKSVSLKDKEYEPRIKDLNGKIIYTHTPEMLKRKSEPWVRIIQYKNLSGNFSFSKFTDLNGELGLKNGKPHEKGSAHYNLDYRDLYWILEKEKEVTLQDTLNFTSGEVLIENEFKGNPEQPETEKEWGKIKLKNLSMKYRNQLQVMTDFNGIITFSDEKFRLQNVLGMYGNSPVHLEGEINPKNKSAPEFSLRLNLPALRNQELKDIPVFSDFNFSGSANISMSINGTPDDFSFEQQSDLTRIGYKIPGLVQKKENTFNQFKAKGVFAEKDGFDIKDWVYELGGNKITGSMHISDLDNRDFSIRLASKKFHAYPSDQISESWTAEGSINFDISGNGNLNQIQDSHFEGKTDLIDLKIKPKNLSSDLILNANLGFKEKRFDIRSANISSSKSKLNFSGVYQLGDSPNLELMFTGEKLDINEFLPTSQGKDLKLIDLLTRTNFYKQGKGLVDFDIGVLSFKMLHLNDVTGKISLKNKVLKIKDWSVGTNPFVKSSANLTIGENGVSIFEGDVEAKDVKTENVFSLFGDVFKNSLSGDVKRFNAKLKGKGKDLKEITRDLSGNISLDIESGMIDKEKLKQGVHELFGSSSSLLSYKEDNRSSFKHLSGDFFPTNGVFETENFIFETNERRTSIVGTFDLTQNQVDAIAGIAPLPKLDQFLTQIPLFGKILTAGDEKSLLKTYYSVKGDFDDPEISPIPFTSLGKKVMGIFQGILETPVEILESLPIEAPSTPTSTVEEDN